MNGVTYMANRTMTWYFFNDVAFFIKKLQNKFTQTIFTTQYQIKKMVLIDCTKH